MCWLNRVTLVNASGTTPPSSRAPNQFSAEIVVRELGAGSACPSDHAFGSKGLMVY